MKKKFLSLGLVLLLSSCSLVPKNVEFFQKKVKPFPDPTPKQEEVQRETAARAKEAAADTLVTAVKEDSSTNLVAKATDTAVLTDAVAVSLGPPISPSGAPATELASDLNHQVAKHNKKVDKFADANEAVEGKKIEGTGLLSVPYFLWVGIIALVVIVGWHLAKLALTAASAANPGAMVGVAGMNITSATAAKAVHQIVTGGEAFLAWVKTEITDSGLSQKITDAFLNAHKKAQDSDVKAVVNQITK